MPFLPDMAQISWSSVQVTNLSPAHNSNIFLFIVWFLFLWGEGGRGEGEGETPSPFPFPLIPFLYSF